MTGEEWQKAEPIMRKTLDGAIHVDLNSPVVQHKRNAVDGGRNSITRSE